MDTKFFAVRIKRGARLGCGEGARGTCMLSCALASRVTAGFVEGAAPRGRRN
jgi:hypothetical protein